MPQKKINPAPTSDAPASPGRMVALRVLLHLMIAAALVGGVVLSFVHLKRYVERVAAVDSEPLVIVLKNKPAWMTDDTIHQIVSVARPRGEPGVFDHAVLADVRARLEACAWVEKVREVRRAYSHAPGDTLEIDCAYRVPAALVHWGDYYWLIDRRGIKLPEQYLEANLPRTMMGADGQVNLRLIEGVQKPPPEAGYVWPGHDVQAGLEMASVLFDRPFADDILKIDVTNIDGRQDLKESQVTLITRYGSRVLWGRLPSASDAFIESSPEKKLQTLQTVYAKFGRVDAKQNWIDIRLDEVLGATPPPPDDSSAHARLDHTR